MRKLFRKLFNLDKVEMLELQVGRLTELWTAEVEVRKKEHSVLHAQNSSLRQELMSYEKTWRGLELFENDSVYYVVTQGGYYQIRGWKINKNVMSEVTRRAVKNGFAVASEREAQDLQRAMQRLGW